MECPYPHEKNVDVTGAGTVFLCDSSKGACYRPILLCEHCDSPNRVLANYCRQCGEDISFTHREAELLSTIKLDSNAQLKPRIRNFAGAGVEGFSLLHVHKGFLIIGTLDGRVFVTDSVRLEAPIEELKVKGAPIAVSTSQKKNDDSLIVATKHAAYKLSFLPKLACEELADYSKIGEVKGPAWMTDAGLISLVAKGENTQLIIEGGGPRRTEEIGESTSPAVFAGGSVYFLSQTRLHVFNTVDNNLTSETLPEDQWNLRAAPVFDPESEQVYFCSENYCYNLPLNTQPPRPMRIPTKPFVNFKIAPTAKKLFVTHSDGLTVINPFRGQKIWDLKEDLFVSRTGAYCAPKSMGNYILFVSLDETGRQEINLMSMADIFDDKKDVRADLISVVAVDDIGLEPVFGLGTMIVAGSREPKLSIYRLLS